MESVTLSVDFTSPELEGVYLIAYQLRSLDGMVLFGPPVTIIIDVRAVQQPEHPIIEANEEEYKEGDDMIPMHPSGNAEGMKSVVASKFADLIKANYAKIVRELPQGQFNPEQIELLLLISRNYGFHNLDQNKEAVLKHFIEGNQYDTLQGVLKHLKDPEHHQCDQLFPDHHHNHDKEIPVEKQTYEQRLHTIECSADQVDKRLTKSLRLLKEFGYSDFDKNLAITQEEIKALPQGYDILNNDGNFNIFMNQIMNKIDQ